MRYHNFQVLATAGLAVCGAAASSWFPGSKTIYNKWHETELERWLSDHSVPYPSPADRKDLENLVDKNWNDKVVQPYNSWEAKDLSNYLQKRGGDVATQATETRDQLVSQVQQGWYETEESTQQAWANVKNWILDTWTESQLKAFADKHDIPVPQPRQRDSVLAKARSNYETIAKKFGETTAYPGDWLYDTWSESDLKSWLDTNGFPAPQPSSRDKLIASVRRNSRLAYLQAQSAAESVTSSAQAAYATLTDMVIDGWSESQLKEFCDKNAIPVPQGTKVNELRALVRKNRAEILGDNVSGKANKAYGAATSNVQSQYASATDSASSAAQEAFNQAIGYWSDTRLKAYLDARGVPVPQESKRDELIALSRKYAHKASSGFSVWTFDDYTYENLKDYLAKNGNAAAQAAAKKKDATRDDLVSAAQSAYSSASTAGSSNYAQATNYMAQVAEKSKDTAFDTWTESQLKSYLDSYGIPVPQGSKIEQLKAEARKQATYFTYGTTTPGQTVLAKLGAAFRDSRDWVYEQLALGSAAAKDKAAEAEAKANQAKKEL